MGNNQGFGKQIETQEKWVDCKFTKINTRPCATGGRNYSTKQIKGALREEYYGRPPSSNNYVLSRDWRNMYSK